MKKAGFTLIELLATIVVLVIIALIAIPIILNIIEKAKKGAVESSATSYLETVETYIVTSEIGNDRLLQLDGSTRYNVTKSTIANGKNYLSLNELVSIKGSTPTGLDDYITLDDKKNVKDGLLTINGYLITIQNRKIVSINKTEKIELQSLSLNYTNETMEKDSTLKLNPIFTPTNASNQEVVYKSSDESIVTVDKSGLVTAKNVGSAKITVTSEEDKNIKAECNIEVVVTATKIEIDKKQEEIVIGEELQLTGKLTPSDTTSKALTWTSSDSNIAYVDDNGLVTGISAGNAIITAKTTNGLTDTSSITVKEIEPTDIQLNKEEVEVLPSYTVKVTATVLPTNASNKELVWKSKDESIATVSNGVITGLNLGTTEVTVSVQDTTIIKTISVKVLSKVSLSNAVSVGDYVAYNAGTWSSTVSSLPTSHGNFGGYTKNNNKAKSINNCYTGVNYSDNPKSGWRVLSISDTTVNLVHAGQPECYYQGSSYANAKESVTILNDRAESQYKNTSFAESAHALNKDEAVAITGSNKYGAQTLRHIIRTYWLAYTRGGELYIVTAGGDVDSSGSKNSSLGFRPVIVLKSCLKTTGKGNDYAGNTNTWLLDNSSC